MQTGETGQTGQSDRRFAEWCVMTQARPVLSKALRAWGLNQAAQQLEKATSLTALKVAVLDADAEVKRRMWFSPLRRDLSHALNTLHAAATFAARGDVTNTAAVAVGALAEAESALAWRKPWQRFNWRTQRKAIIESALNAQRELKAMPQQS